MTERTNEILKTLNRLSNDRVIPRQARNQIQDAANYIKKLHEQIEHFDERLRDADITDTQFEI